LYRILLIALVVLAVPSTKVTLSIPLQPGPEPELIAVVTFDTDRVSATDVKRWMLLHESSYYDTSVFGYYPECKPSDVPKLEKDIKKTQQIVDDLDPNKYPPALNDVVRYLKDLQSLWLWQAQQELAFLNSGKLPQTEYNGVDLRMCEVRNSEDKQRMCYEVLHRWHNCATNTVGRRLGSYPKEKWKGALDALGIQEQLRSGMNE
jgi:hypothetical protein